MSMSHFAITTCEKESLTDLDQRTDLTKWAQTVLLIQSQKPLRPALTDVRTLAAARILNRKRGKR